MWLVELCIVLFMDLDGTLWDHEDISTLKPPFKKTSDYSFIDSHGVEVRVYRIAVDLLNYALSQGFITSTLSWNIPEIALDALETMGLDKLFHYHAIENHPYKALMAQRIVEALKRAKCSRVIPIYIDDREIHVEEMRRAFPGLLYIRAWVTCSDLRGCIEIINNYLRSIKNNPISL